MSVLVLANESPVARKEHRCELCCRTIKPGERYGRQRNIGDDGAYVFKACAHCHALTVLTSVTEAAEYDGDGYTADDFWEWQPGTVWEARLRAQYRREWRRRDGTLYPVPAANVATPDDEQVDRATSTLASARAHVDPMTGRAWVGGS